MRGGKALKSCAMSTHECYAWSQGSKIVCCLHARALCLESGPRNRVLSPRKSVMPGARALKSCAVSTQERYAWSQGLEIVRSEERRVGKEWRWRWEGESGNKERRMKRTRRVSAG